MTKKHFVMIAQVIRNARMRNADGYDDPRQAFNDEAINAPYLQMARMFAAECLAENPRFDEKHFMEACGF